MALVGRHVATAGHFALLSRLSGKGKLAIEALGVPHDEMEQIISAADDDEVVVRVSGRAAFGVGAEYVLTGVIEPALRKIAGDDCAIRIKKTVPTANRRA